MNRDATSDEARMAHYAATGDPAAFEAIYRAWSPRLHGFFLRHTASPELAADLVQQTFLHLHRARRDYRDGAPLRPWLFTIALNVLRQERRRRRRKPEVALDPERHPMPTTPAATSSPEDRLVQRALAALPEGQRLVILLHWYEDMPFPEVARTLGLSTSAVKVRAHRGYKALRRMLREGVEPPADDGHREGR